MTLNTFLLGVTYNNNNDDDDNKIIIIYFLENIDTEGIKNNNNKIAFV